MTEPTAVDDRTIAATSESNQLKTGDVQLRVVEMETKGSGANPPLGNVPGSTSTEPPPESAPATQNGNGYEPLRLLRLLQAEAQDLRGVIRSIRSSESTLEQNAGYLKAAGGRIDQLVLEIGKAHLADTIGVESDHCVRHIQNAREQMKTSRLMTDPGGSFSAPEQGQLMNLLDGHCRQLVFWTGSYTIPHRLKDWLKESRTGYVIPFNAVFEDEMPDAEDRQKILNVLAYSPRELQAEGGIINPADGLVYRYSPK